jgi:multicomponent Na+:H+ antiporter subunit E
VNVLFINMLLAFVWMFLTASFLPSTLIEGFLIGYVVLWLGRPLYDTSSYFKKFNQVISFLFFFMREMVVATARVAYIVIKPEIDIQPGIIAVPLDIKTNAEITLLANLITLTPGTLSLDVSSDGRVIYVHTMHVSDVDEFRREIKQGFERRVGELFG